MSKYTNKRTFIVRITTELSFPDFTSLLTQAGDVEHVQLKDGSVNPLTAHTLPAQRLKRRFSPEGLVSVQRAHKDWAARAHKHRVITLANFLRTNAHAPMIKLVSLMNATDATPTRNVHIQWNETTLAKYIDEALELVTAPDAPQPQG